MCLNNSIHSYGHWEPIVQCKWLLCLSHAISSHIHVVTSQSTTIDGSGLCGHMSSRTPAKTIEIELLRSLKPQCVINKVQYKLYHKGKQKLLLGTPVQLRVNANI